MLSRDSGSVFLKFAFLICGVLSYLQVDLDPVYTGTDPNGSVPVWVQIGLPFTLDLLDPYRYGSVIRTSLGSFSKVHPFGSVPVEVQCKRLDPIQTGTDRG